MWLPGETGEGGQGEALPGEAFSGRQLVHLGRDPGHEGQPGLPEGGGGHQPAGHPEPPGGQEAGQAGQGGQQWGLLLSLGGLLSQIGTGRDIIQNWSFPSRAWPNCKRSWDENPCSKSLSLSCRIGGIPILLICSIRLPWIGHVGHPLQVQKLTIHHTHMFLMGRHTFSNLGMAFREEICSHEYGLPWPSGFRQFCSSRASTANIGSQ